MIRLLLGVLAFIVGLVIIGLFLPSTNHVEKQAVIRAPASRIYERVNDLRTWELWSPWREVDPRAVMAFSDNPVGEGAWVSWDSRRRELRKGKATIITTVPNQKIVLDFVSRERERGRMTWRFEQQSPERTLVTLSMDVDNKGLTGKWQQLLGETVLEKRLARMLDNQRRIEEVRLHPLPKTNKEILRDIVDSMRSKNLPESSGTEQ